MKITKINESFDSPQAEIARYETDINDTLMEFEDAYFHGKITTEPYAKLLKDIWNVIETSNLTVEDLDEAYERDVNLVTEMLKVSGLLSVEKLGEDNWIEFDFGEERRFTNGRKFVQFDAIGETKRLRGRVEVTDDGRYDVKINYGSEAKCNSAVEIARFIAGEFGVALNESRSNSVSNKLPASIDNFLQDIAQVHGGITYNDIMRFDPDESQLKELKKLYTKYREEAKYESEDKDAILKSIAHDVVDIVGHHVDESLKEHRLTSLPLRQANIDAIDYFIEFEYIYHFPEGRFLARNWKDLRDGVVLGIDDDIELAEGIMLYLQKEIDFNNKHKEIYDDDPQAELTLEVYNNVKRAYEKEISKYESVSDAIKTDNGTFTRVDNHWEYKPNTGKSGYSLSDKELENELKDHKVINEGTNLKRIARRGEFDNGKVLHSDWKEMTEEDAQEAAKQASIEDPKDVYYVAYDDIMNPSADNVWVDGKSYKSENVTLRPDGPVIKE